MAGIASVGSVGAGLSEAQFQVQYQEQALEKQQQVTGDLCSATLKLIRTVLANSTMHDLDVLA